MSSAIYQPIIDSLSQCKRVLVTTHVRPDGDALGSTAGMILGLRKKGIAAEALLLSELPRKYAFVYNDSAIVHHVAEKSWPENLSLDAFDALLVIDTGTWSQLPGLRERIEKWPKPKLIVDHHLTQENWADKKAVDTTAAAAGEMVGELLLQWGIEIDAAIASALYLAIVSDTGWFQYSNTRPQTLRLAAKLMEAGVNTDQLYQLLYQSERVQRIALQARVQHSLELLAEGKLAVMRVRNRDLDETGAEPAESEAVINIPLQIKTVEVSILLSESRDNSPVRISLRSKGKIDVAQFAQSFGGGGHARAAGLRVAGPFEQVHDQVVTALVDRLAATLPAAER